MTTRATDLGRAAEHRPAGGGGVQLDLRTLALARLGSPNVSDGVPEDRFLDACRAAVGSRSESWTAALTAYLERPSPVDVPLLHVAGVLGFSVTEILSIALAAAVEQDTMVGRVVAYLQAPLGGSRPTLGLLAETFGPGRGGDVTGIELLAAGNARQSGLLAVDQSGAPLTERTVSVPVHLLLALTGVDSAVPAATIGLPSELAIPLSPSLAQVAEQQAAALLAAPRRVLVVRSGSPVEAKAVAAAVASSLGVRPLFMDGDGQSLPGLAVLTMLRRLLPVFSVELTPGERKLVPAVPFYQGPVVVLCGPDGSVESASGTALSWRLPVPRRDEREMLWREALGNDDAAVELARHHRHGCGRIAALGKLAEHQGAVAGRSRPVLEDVIAASRTGEGVGLDALAEPLLSAIPSDALVLSPTLEHDLQTLLARARARDELTQGLGASVNARYTPGVRALFVGPSGTGKTLAACWLATQLGLPLYRVDLAAVTSKYIGETEKNLALLLARAEQAEVVLLFDEADSMFGKRTEIREANDRFANAQTNYLLQRIESYDGITILTSNSRMRFDPAFARRLDVIIDFPLPAPDQRRSLWQSHLGQDHRLSAGDLNRLAVTADLAGGQIRNAVLTAAVAAHQNGGTIEYAHVLDGLTGEYRKLGKQVPVALTRLPK